MSNEKTVTAVRVRRPRGRAAGSMAEQIDNLEPGQTISLSTRFAVGSHTAGGDDIKAALNSMRGSLGTYLSRVQADNDGLDMREYRSESGCFLTDDKTAIIATVALTRLT